jgi:hypothetical protein
MFSQTQFSIYFLISHSFCLSCPSHQFEIIRLNYTKLKVIQLAYAAPSSPNTTISTLMLSKERTVPSRLIVVVSIFSMRYFGALKVEYIFIHCCNIGKNIKMEVEI